MRRLALAPVLLLIGLLSAAPARAAEISLQSLEINGLVNVQVSLANVDDLFGFDFLVAFDPALYAFRGVDNSSAFGDAFTFFNPFQEDQNGDPVLDEFGNFLPVEDVSPVTIAGLIFGQIPGVTEGLLATLLFESLGAGTGTFDLQPRLFLNSQFGEIHVDVASASPTPVPEPSTLALLGAGLAVLARRRRLRRKTTVAGQPTDALATQ